MHRNSFCVISGEPLSTSDDVKNCCLIIHCSSLRKKRNAQRRTDNLSKAFLNRFGQCVKRYRSNATFESTAEEKTHSARPVDQKLAYSSSGYDLLVALIWKRAFVDRPYTRG